MDFTDFTDSEFAIGAVTGKQSQQKETKATKKNFAFVPFVPFCQKEMEIICSWPGWARLEAQLAVRLAAWLAARPAA
jgi:hypothetical protein